MKEAPHTHTHTMSYNTTHTNNQYEDDDYYTAYLEDTPHQNSYHNTYEPSPPLSLLSEDLEQIINTHKHIYSQEQLRELVELRDLKKQQEQNDWYNEQIYYRSITETDSQEVKDKMKQLLLSNTNNPSNNTNYNLNYNHNAKRSRPADHPLLEHNSQKRATFQSTNSTNSNNSTNTTSTASHDQAQDHPTTNKKRKKDV